MTTEKFQPIALPSVSREAFDFTSSWTEIQSAEQLPRRLFIGDLDKNTFSPTPDGWQAKYIGGLFSVIAERRDGMISLEERFQNHSVQSIHFTDRLKGWEFLRCAPRNSKAYDAQLKEYYETRYNIRYCPTQEENKLQMVNYVPDGFAQVLIAPIPMRNEVLIGLTKAMHELQSQKTIAIHGCLKFIQSWVNYREGKCPNVPVSTVDHLCWVSGQGYLPANAATWEGTATDRALTSYRLGYVLVIPFFMRDGPEILDCLAAHKVILPPDTDESERLAFILHLQDLFICETVNAFSNDKSRRVGFLLGVDNDKLGESAIKMGKTSLIEFESAIQSEYRNFQTIVQDIQLKLMGER